jgi:hypothetical protein
LKGALLEFEVGETQNWPTQQGVDELKIDIINVKEFWGKIWKKSLLLN